MDVIKTIPHIRKLSTVPTVLTKEVGKNVLIMLNNPKRSNAITIPQLIDLHKLLTRFENEMTLLILRGAGDRAFSSGADLLVLKEECLTNLKYIEDLMLKYNRNLYLLSIYKIPTVALMNGITFGGGAGYSVHSKYRIATEKTVFAMPEIKVAFHPNASSTYFLNKLPGKLGIYLGLTGNSLRGHDVLCVGLATHFCDSKKLEKLEEALLNSSNEKDVEYIIESISENQIPEFSLKNVMENINKCFSESTVEAIITNLERDDSSWAKETLNTLKRHSPTALKITLRQFREGKNKTLKDCLIMESNLSINCFKYPDIYEGIRVLLQDKNDTPKWNPSNLSEVTEEMIDRFFTPVAEDLQELIFNDVDDSR